jgi:hypothetical protein
VALGVPDSLNKQSERLRVRVGVTFLVFFHQVNIYLLVYTTKSTLIFFVLLQQLCANTKTLFGVAQSHLAEYWWCYR